MKKRILNVTMRSALAVWMVMPMLMVTAALGVPVRADNGSVRELRVMTRNMYLGTDLEQVFNAQDQLQLVFKVTSAYANVRVSNIPERAAAVADEIADARPDLVGLQEATLWRTGPFLPDSPATTVAYDSLQSLLDALAARGLHYAPVAMLINLDAEATAFAPSGALFDVRLTDRDVVLARTDLKTSEFKLEDSEAQHFHTILSFPTAALGVLTIPRGWISVDAQLRGKPYRFVTTHLESFYQPVQFAQANELINGPGRTQRTVVLAGDFNSDAESTDPAQNSTYQLLLSAGFVDAWKQKHPNEAGYTWALHENDPFVFTIPHERLDLVLWRGNVEALSADVVGEDQSTDLTPSGLWPSDHAGVVTTFNLKP